MGYLMAGVRYDAELTSLTHLSILILYLNGDERGSNPCACISHML